MQLISAFHHRKSIKQTLWMVVGIIDHVGADVTSGGVWNLPDRPPGSLWDRFEAEMR